MNYLNEPTKTRHKEGGEKMNDKNQLHLHGWKVSPAI